MKVMQDPSFEGLHDKFYPKSKIDVEKAMNRDRMVAKDIGEVVWNAIRTVERVYEQEVYVGIMECEGLHHNKKNNLIIFNNLILFLNFELS